MEAEKETKLMAELGRLIYARTNLELEMKKNIQRANDIATTMKTMEE